MSKVGQTEWTNTLENEEIQQAYEEHMINAKIKLALDSLLSEPFETLVAAIRREFKEERVGVPEGIKITKKHVEDFIQSISDESGRIPVDLEAEVIHTDDAVQENIIASGTGSGKRVRAHGKRVMITDLLAEGVVKEGDQWKLSSKGETTWGRVESNGQLEVNGKGYGNPSKAFMAVLGKPGNGWYYWPIMTRTVSTAALTCCAAFTEKRRSPHRGAQTAPCWRSTSSDGSRAWIFLGCR